MPSTDKDWSGLLLTQNQRDESEIQNGFTQALNPENFLPVRTASNQVVLALVRSS
ncbi:MAG: hypothetical protein N4J56_007170 [Chroococcidiopsis sp. SAG 2025]|uniref:hypothetical protein n=1 Tax=Chroococcidiopsis sp. SAG 2025 TaxID=171389 RepID=UPI002937086F|nr:hypothetical protein [Chroococcidiopsis sp. SAG 2025]MDV2997465.1 hypothetical protein [Chroococcidiopsis sp. SAG 2025]